MRLTFKSGHLELIRLPSIMWWVSFNQLMALREKDLGPLRNGNSASRLPLDSSCNISSSLGLQPAGLPCRFQSCYNFVSQFFKISLSLSPDTHTHTHTHTHTQTRTLLVLLFSGEPWLIHIRKTWFYKYRLWTIRKTTDTYCYVNLD